MPPDPFRAIFDHQPAALERHVEACHTAGMLFHTRRWIVLTVLVLCPAALVGEGNAQPAVATGREALLQGLEARTCRKRPTVGCLSDLAFQIGATEPDPSLTAHYLAGAGRSADAYALLNQESGKVGNGALFRIALQQVTQAALARPDVAADLSPFEAAAAASADPKQTMLIGLRMAGNELTGAQEEVNSDSAVLSSYGKAVIPHPAMPRATVGVILAKWREVEPGSPGPVSVLLALGDRQAAIMETARLVSDPKMLPHNAASAWAEVGEAGRAAAIENKAPTPRASVFIEAAEVMTRFGQPAATITEVWKRALFLLTEPVHEADFFTSPRQVIAGIAASDGREAALGAAGVAADRSRSVIGRRKPFLLAEIGAAYLDLGDSAKARSLLNEAIAALGPNDHVPSYMAILMYRLRDHAGFEAAMAAFGDDRDPRAPGSDIRGQVWMSLIREKDVDPTLAFVTRAAVGGYAHMKPHVLVELAIRRMQQGRRAEVPPLIRAIAEADRQLLADNGNEFYRTGTYDTLAAAGQLSRAIHDDRGSVQVLRVMVDAAFDSGRFASWQMAQVASFWHRRLPDITRVPDVASP